METLLYKYFFKFIDRGITQNDTPLFSGVYQGESLIKAVSFDHMELRDFEIVELINAARKEVKL